MINQNPQSVKKFYLVLSPLIKKLFECLQLIFKSKNLKINILTLFTFCPQVAVNPVSRLTKTESFGGRDLATAWRTKGRLS